MLSHLFCASGACDPLYREITQDEKECFDRISDYCSFYSSKNTAVYLIGDSHMDSISLNLKEHMKNLPFRLTLMTNSGAPYFPNFFIYPSKQPTLKKAIFDINAKRKEFISNDIAEMKIALVGARLPLYFEKSYFDNRQGGTEALKAFDMEIRSVENNEVSKKDIINAYVEGIKHLATLVDYVILISPTPENGWLIQTQLNKTGRKKDFELDANWLSVNHKTVRKRLESSRLAFELLTEKNIVKINTENIFCDTFVPGRCVVTDGKKFLYTDGDHLSYAGSKLLVSKITDQLKKYVNR